MSWSIGFDSNWDRDIGYGVPAPCDHPECDWKIDRGLAHVCGGDPYGGDQGCGLYFCSSHLWFGRSKDAPQLCKRCMNYKQPYKPKPDLLEWIEFKLKDSSWSPWRKVNLEKVKQMRMVVENKSPKALPGFPLNTEDQGAFGK